MPGRTYSDGGVVPGGLVAARPVCRDPPAVQEPGPGRRDGRRCLWVFDDRPVNVELVSAFLTFKQAGEVKRYLDDFTDPAGSLRRVGYVWAWLTACRVGSPAMTFAATDGRRNASAARSWIRAACSWTGRWPRRPLTGLSPGRATSRASTGTRR